MCFCIVYANMFYQVPGFMLFKFFLFCIMFLCAGAFILGWVACHVFFGMLNAMFSFTQYVGSEVCMCLCIV